MTHRRASSADRERAPLLCVDDRDGSPDGSPDGSLDGSPDRLPGPPAATDDKAMPKAQVALLCFARVVEPIAFFGIFPYINQMVQANGQLADTDVGFYSGLIESLFSLTQALVMLSWGRAADRVGRKPVLVLSLVGMSGATALFGLARSLPQMVAFRCLAGLFSGTIVTIRTMLAEHSTSATQARIFSWFAFSGNLGIFIGPLLGGALADPFGTGTGTEGPAFVTTTEGPFFVTTTKGFFATYPYALPGFVIAGLGFVAALTSALFVGETLVRTPAASDGDAPRSTALRPLLAAPGVAIVLYVYAHVMLLAFAYTAIIPVVFFTPVDLGGMGMTPRQIAAMMGVNGAAQAAWLLLAFPPLQHRLGTNGVMRLCAAAYPFFMALCPLLGMLLRYAHAATAFWLLAPPLLAVGCGVSMCFTAIQLAVNDVAPDPRLLNMLNALALTGVSITRAITPALFASLFAVGARTQWLHGYAIWVLMVALAAGYTVAVRYLPDYDALKKQREEER